MSKFQVVIATLLFFMFLGCSQDMSQSAATEEETLEPVDETSSRSSGAAEEPQSSSPAPATSQDPIASPTSSSKNELQGATGSKQAPAILTVLSGTELRVRLANSVSSETNQTGDNFEAILDQDLVVDGHVVAPNGSTLMGQLTEVVPSGKVKGRAKITLQLRELRTGEGSYPIESDQISVESEGSMKEDATKVGIGVGIGAVVGAIAGGKKGAAVGTAIGGGTGTAAVLLTKGNEVEFEAEQEFQFQLVEDLKVTLR